MQKTADRSNKHTNQIISVTYICIQLPTSNLGNDLVTELLLKSALSCLLQIEQFYANCLVSTSLPISLHIFRYFFIFLDQLLFKSNAINLEKESYYKIKDMVFLLISPSSTLLRQHFQNFKSYCFIIFYNQISPISSSDYIRKIIKTNYKTSQFEQYFDKVMS